MALTLLDLPTELRLQIYGYLLASRDEFHNPWLGLLLTSKFFNDEMSCVLKDATLRFRISPRVFHQALAQNLRLDKIEYAEVEDSPFTRIDSFENYCRRFREVVFDITETSGPTECRIPPSYERKAKELAASLSERLFKSINTDNSSGATIDIKWGSFSRHVYRGIVTWQYCVLKGLGGLMALSRTDESELTEVLDCAIVLEDQRRRGLLPESALTTNELAVSAKKPAIMKRLSLGDKIRHAMHSRA